MRQWGFSLPCIADWSLSVANVSPLTLSGNNFPSQKRKHIWAEIGWNWPKSAICVMQMIRTHVSNRMSGVVPADSAKVVFCSFSWYLYPPYAHIWKVKRCRTVVTLKNVYNHFVTFTHRTSQKEIRGGPYYYISCDGPAGLFRLSFMVGLVTRLADSVILFF